MGEMKINIKQIRGLMAYEGITVKDAARQIGVSERTLAHWIANPDGFRLGAFLKLAEILGVEDLKILFVS